MIEERHAKTQQKEKPSEVFKRYFGAQNGVDLPELTKFGAQPIDFSDGDAVLATRLFIFSIPIFCRR